MNRLVGILVLTNWQPKFPKWQQILIFCVLLYGLRQCVSQVPRSLAHTLHDHPAHAYMKRRLGRESNSYSFGYPLKGWSSQRRVKCKKCMFI